VAGETQAARGLESTRTVGVAVAREAVLNEESTQQIDAPRAVPRKVLDRLRSAAPKVKLIEALRANPRDTGPWDDLLLSTVLELGAIYDRSPNYNALYLQDVAVLERWFWPQALTFLEATVADMREALARLHEPYRTDGLPVQSLFTDLLSWMGLITNSSAAAESADKAIRAVQEISRDPVLLRDQGESRYEVARVAQEAHRQTREAVTQFELTIHSRHPLFPLVRSYLEDRGRLGRVMQRPEWSASTLYPDAQQVQATIELVQAALDFGRVSIDGLERRVQRREWEDMTAILRAFVAGNFQRDLALADLCNDFIADRVGLTLVDVLGLIGMAVGVATLIVATAGGAAPLLLGLAALELGLGVAEFIATLQSRAEAEELNRLATWNATWRVADAQGSPALAGVMVAISLASFVPGARQLLAGLRWRSARALTVEVVEATGDAATSVRRVRGPDPIELPAVDEPVRLERATDTAAQRSTTDADRGLRFEHTSDVDPARPPRGLQRNELPSTGAERKRSAQEMREERARVQQEIEPHRAEPVRTDDTLIEGFESHNVRRASFSNPGDQWLDDLRRIVTDQANPLRLGAEEVLALRAIDARDWTALIGKVSVGERAAFNKGGREAIGAIGKLKGAIQELFIPHLPGYARALEDARAVIRLKNLGIPDDAVKFSRVVTDADGQLTDGVIYAVRDDTVYIFSVFEAKSKGNLLDVARTQFGPDDVPDFINRGQIESSLRRLETNAVSIDGQTFPASQVLLGPDAGYRTRWLVIAPSDARTARTLSALEDEIAGQGRAVEVVTSPLTNDTYGELARRILVLLTGR
jgi:hypothetical protein